MKPIITFLGLAALALLAGCVAPHDPAHDLQRKVAVALRDTLTQPQPGQDGLVTVADGNKFVQCRQSEQLAGWRCESAGTMMQPSLQAVLTPDHVAGLAALGFQPDAAFGNYILDVPTSTEPATLAATVVKALTEDYAAQAETTDVDARYIAAQTCPLRVNFSQDQAGSIAIHPNMLAVTTAACSAIDTIMMPPLVDKDSVRDSKMGPSPTIAIDKRPANVVTAYLRAITKEVARLRSARSTHIWIALDGNVGYVQCKPDLEDKAFYCEAASAESNKDVAAQLTPQRIAFLHMAGFEDPGRVENYARMFPFKQFKDADVARLLLTILHHVYGFDGTALLGAHDELGDVTLIPQ